MLSIRTILHPTDFSERSDHAFQVACALARDYGARLILVHVQVPPPVAFAEEAVPLPEPEGYEKVLKDRLERLRPPDGRIAVEHHLLVGDPAGEVVRLAKEKKCDLIVMGTHGRTGLGRLLMGSVAELVLRRAECPVLTVKAPFPDRPGA